MRIYNWANWTGRTFIAEVFNDTQHSIMASRGNGSDLMHESRSNSKTTVMPVVLTQIREHVDYTKMASASGHLVLMLVVGTLAVCLLGFIVVLFPSLSSSKDPRDVDEESDAKLAQQLADNLRRTIRKLPATRKSKSGHSKERFIAILAGDPAKQAKRSDDDADDVAVVQKWEGGKVAWWHDAQSYQRREAPKGELLLKSIASAVGGCKEKYSHTEVTLNYADGLETKKLLLFLPSQYEASEWAIDFNKLLRLVRPSKTPRTSAKSPTESWRKTTADAVRKLTSASLVASLHSTFLNEKDDTETDLDDSDSDRGN